MQNLWVHEDNTGVRIFIKTLQEIVYNEINGKSTDIFEISAFRIPVVNKTVIEIFPANEKFEVISYKPFINNLESINEAMRTLEEMEK